MTDYYVNSSTGSDTNDGSSPTVGTPPVGPWKTLNKAVTQMETATLTEAVTVHIAGTAADSTQVTYAVNHSATQYQVTMQVTQSDSFLKDNTINTSPGTWWRMTYTGGHQFSMSTTNRANVKLKLIRLFFDASGESSNSNECIRASAKEMHVDKCGFLGNDAVSASNDAIYWDGPGSSGDLRHLVVTNCVFRDIARGAILFQGSSDRCHYSRMWVRYCAVLGGGDSTVNPENARIGSDDSRAYTDAEMDVRNTYVYWEGSGHLQCFGQDTQCVFANADGHNISGDGTADTNWSGGGDWSSETPAAVVDANILTADVDGGDVIVENLTTDARLKAGSTSSTNAAVERGGYLDSLGAGNYSVTDDIFGNTRPTSADSTQPCDGPHEIWTATGGPRAGVMGHVLFGPTGGPVG